MSEEKPNETTSRRRRSLRFIGLVAVVVLAIRWSSHSYGEVKQFCEQYGKPLVRLPAGYNPNQVAAHIVAQCSDRLAQQS